MDSKNKYLDFYKENFGQGKYCSKSWGLASFEAGQQSRQAEIDELNRKLRMYEKHVNAIKHIHETQFDHKTDTSWILGNLDGFFEYLESDLKGEKYDH